MKRCVVRRWFGGRLGWTVATAFLLAPRVAWGAATTVREPAFGLPHIFADTDLELARENGREIAKDRLAQLILLARVGRGTLYQAFGLLDATTLNADIEARQTAYTSSELNNMYAKLPQRERNLILEYCKGVNDTLDDVYAGILPEPIEVNILRALGLGSDLFGNKNNISDQVDPHYAAPGGEWPNSGFQFTPEMAMAIGVLEVRNFGLESFEEDQRYAELQALTGVHGGAVAAQLWDDLNFLNDPLAPVTVPDATTPGFGGPLSATSKTSAQVASAASQYPRYDYLGQARQREEAALQRKDLAMRWGAWPALGSYAWLIAGGKSATGWPWLGGFPQTGIQTPSIMHFVENRSAEGANHRVSAIGMEFAGAPLILIGQTDTVAYTTTTALLRIVDTFFERVVNEDSDTLRYSDEGTPAPLKKRTESFLGGPAPSTTRVFWRTHERNANKGSRAVADFIGDKEGAANGGTPATLVDTDVTFDSSYVGGYVAIVDGPGAGQIRQISAVPDANTLQVGTAWTTQPTGQTPPDTGSVYVAVKPGNTIIAVAIDSPLWQEESTTILGFAQYQRAESILDIRAGARLIPSTHNFLAADNRPFNGIGTESGNGNIGYWASGLSRYRLGGQDPRLPLDGTVANPLVVASGVVSSATPTSLIATTGVFGSQSFAPPPYNYRYENPDQRGTEYSVSIMTGSGAKQTRRIASNTSDTLTIEYPWGVTPSGGDTFEVYKIVAMPEVINPAEGYTANWNNKQATADEGNNFGRQFRHIFILERLAAENAWDRNKQRLLNKDLAGLDGKGAFGRYLLPRLRQSVDAVGNGGNPNVDSILAALEAHQGAPDYGRGFIDPVADTTIHGAIAFLNSLVNKLAQDIYGDEYSGAVSVPGGSRGLNIVQHAIDSAAGDLVGGYSQAYTGDYFNGTDWRVVIRDSLSALATSPTLPAATARPLSQYKHPLSALFPELIFPTTPAGNRGTYEQIMDVRPALNGEFMFPLGQSGLIEGTLAGVTSIDPNVTTLHPIWRDWRFVPMLHVSQDVGPTPDHYMCYKAKKTPQTPKFEKRTVTLADQFESGSFDVKKPKAICAPADKEGEGIRDDVTHYASYAIKGAADHTPQLGIEVTDQFGSLTLDTVKPARLFVPSTKGLGAAPSSGPAPNVDHYKCYKVKISENAPKFPKDVQAAVLDQFEDRLYDVKKPTRLCTPVGKDGAPIFNQAGHLMCYKVKPADNEPKHIRVNGQIHVNNQFGTDQRLDTVKEDELCVPAVKNGLTAGEDFDGDGVLDGYERWYYGDPSPDATSDTDADGSTLLDEFADGSDPTDSDTDDDGIPDGGDSKPQDRLLP